MNVRVKDTVSSVLKQNVCFLYFVLIPKNNSCWKTKDFFFVL